jgi:alpha-L-fucosidase 2
MWANGVDGPWHVDYHNNINLQMNYWPACSTNLTECEQPLIDFIRTLVEPGTRTASAYFGARGWTAAISGNIFGFTAPLTDHDMSWNFNPMAGPWLATHIWEYYDYTRDKEWLRRVGYDILKQSALFAQDYLWQRPDGTYTAAPSTSPEHGPVDEGTTFVHGVIREVLMDAIDASKALGVDSKQRAQWQQVLQLMAPYRVGRYGQLMEWSKDIDDPTDEHRHVNHLFGLHPGHTISPITTPELAQASRVVLEHRGDGATGWSMGWKLNQWARLQDGNHAYLLFGNLLKNGTTDNLWDIHPPFQIDGNFGGTAGITEMLLQSHAGFIQLLPALPEAWSQGSVSGLRARGGFEVAMTWDEGQLTEAVLLSLAGEPCTVRYGQATATFKTTKGKTYRLRIEKGKISVK